MIISKKLQENNSSLNSKHPEHPLIRLGKENWPLIMSRTITPLGKNALNKSAISYNFTCRGDTLWIFGNAFSDKYYSIFASLRQWSLEDRSISLMPFPFVSQTACQQRIFPILSRKISDAVNLLGISSRPHSSMAAASLKNTQPIGCSCITILLRKLNPRHLSLSFILNQ